VAGVYQSLIVGNQLAIKSLSTLVRKRLGVGPIWLARRKESREKTPGGRADAAQTLELLITVVRETIIHAKVKKYNRK
jgi:hypothetical protein